jgi:hypothetical protein
MPPKIAMPTGVVKVYLEILFNETVNAVSGQEQKVVAYYEQNI